MFWTQDNWPRSCFCFQCIQPPPLTPQLLAQLPKQPLQKTAAHSQEFGVVVGGGANEQEIFLWVGVPFPLNCPTWLSVLSLNKHHHFLLAKRMGHTDAHNSTAHKYARIPPAPKSKRHAHCSCRCTWFTVYTGGYRAILQSVNTMALSIGGQRVGESRRKMERGTGRIWRREGPSVTSGSVEVGVST